MGLTVNADEKPMASIPQSEADQLLRAIDVYEEPVTRLGLRHFGSKESGYVFSGVENLIASFQADIERWNHENSDT